MVKNVKLDDEVHRSLSIKAGELTCKKSDLCSALVLAALARMTDEEIRTYLDSVTSHGNKDAEND